MRNYSKSPASRRYRKRLPGSRCCSGHVFLNSYSACPVCGGSANPVRLRPWGILLVHTILYVTPTGAPVRVGIAEVSRNARTLCIIEGRIRGNNREKIFLTRRNGLFIAAPPRKVSKPASSSPI